MAAQASGTPQMVCDKLEHWHAAVGRFDLIFGFGAAGIRLRPLE